MGAPLGGAGTADAAEDVAAAAVDAVEADAAAILRVKRFVVALKE